MREVPPAASRVDHKNSRVTDTVYVHSWRELADERRKSEHRAKIEARHADRLATLNGCVVVAGEATMEAQPGTPGATYMYRVQGERT